MFYYKNMYTITQISKQIQKYRTDNGPPYITLIIDQIDN